MNTHYNLLTEPIFTIDTPDGARSRRSLPAVLGGLAKGEHMDFGALQAHQVQSWESFLIQLAALATARSEGEVLSSEEAWRSALRELSGGDDSAFCLVVDDATKPAFMQPPIAGQDFRDVKTAYRASDALDMLVTSKNHDVKMSRATRSSPEHWVFSLVSLQTSDGFAGRDTYGIARMNGGYGSRPSVGATAGIQLAARFQRDLALWNERRDRIAEDFGLKKDGLALVWIAPWDGESSLAIGDLDPCFIEICRRVRLHLDRVGVLASTTSTKVRRVNAETSKGELGDVWIPIKRGKEERTAFTAGGNGFGYKVIADLLLGESYDRSAAMELRPEDPSGMVILARVLPRGQGKTQGLHERAVPIPPKARARVFGQKTLRDPAAKLAKERIEDAGKVQNKVLHIALCALLQAASEDQKLDFTDDRTQRWKRAYDERVDAEFFDALWDDLEIAVEDPNEGTRRWHKRIVDIARETFRGALDSVPLPSVRAYRARAVAERVFEGAARKNFPMAFQPAPSQATQENSP